MLRKRFGAGVASRLRTIRKLTYIKLNSQRLAHLPVPVGLSWLTRTIVGPFFTLNALMSDPFMREELLTIRFWFHNNPAWNASAYHRYSPKPCTCFN